MCGITGIISKIVNTTNNQVKNDLYASLLNIQHRGQDACGYVLNTASGSTSSDASSTIVFKGRGLVKNTISYNKMLEVEGNCDIAIGHVRYPTTSGKGDEESQPFTIQTKTGITISIVHNGNLYDYNAFKKDILAGDYKPKTESDTEFLLSAIAYLIDNVAKEKQYVTASEILKNFSNIISVVLKKLYAQIKGSYSVLLLIENYGLVGFCDKYAVKPLILGETDYNFMFVSESIALDVLDYTVLYNIKPYSVYTIFNNYGDSRNLTIHTAGINSNNELDIRPCIFEYVYFARPESVIHNISVYETRCNMGSFLASKIRRVLTDDELTEIDTIIPVPDTSVVSSCELSAKLHKPIKFGIIKNRYIDRTFIMKNNAERTSNIKQKLYVIEREVKGKNIIIVDDSIVRGNTCFHTIKELRKSGANKIYLAVCCPQIRYKNVYGIDIPVATELIAHNRSDEEIARCIDADKVIYQDLEDLKKAVSGVSTNISGIKDFELSVFNGEYIT